MDRFDDRWYILKENDYYINGLKVVFRKSDKVL